MILNPQETQGAIRWFVGAGLFAVLFSFFLYRADEGLSHSTRDKVLGETLYELRAAQTALGSGATDPRQLHHPESPLTAAQAPHDVTHE